MSILKHRLGYDDSLDAFGCHGLGGTWGAIATGIFASTAINPAGTDGLLAGNVAQLGVQLISVVVSWAFAAAATFVILKVVAKVIPLRLSAEDEEAGLDITQHGEDAYPDFVLAATSAGHARTGKAIPVATRAPEAGFLEGDVIL